MSNPARHIETWLANVLTAALGSGADVTAAAKTRASTKPRVYPYIVSVMFAEPYESGQQAQQGVARCIIAVEGAVASEGATPTGKESAAVYDMMYQCIAAITAADYEAAVDTGTEFKTRLTGVGVTSHDGCYNRGDNVYRAGVECFVNFVMIPQ